MTSRVLATVAAAMLATSTVAPAAADPLVPGGRFFSYDRAATYQVRVERVRVPVRDGSEIACDLRRPAAHGRFPGIVYEYNAYDQLGPAGQAADYFVARGYTALVCNARGSGASPGVLDPFSAQEQRDNYDVIEWLAAQPWSTGRIGQLGNSYGGHTALLAAVNKPPHLVTIIPVNGISDWYENTIYRGGIYSARIRDWQSSVAPDTLRTYPMHPLYDDFWRERSVQARWDALDIPVLEINGWYDRYRDGMVRNYQARKENVWLVSGPWEHGMPENQYAGIGPNAYLAWLDRWLRRLPGAPLPEAKVLSYEIPGPGVGRGWQEFSDWPPVDARQRKLSLTTSGRLASAAGAPGTRVYDVNTDPSPAQPGESLSFDGDPLSRDLVLAGDIEARIQVSTTASDGNVAVVVQDAAPDGTVRRITAGWVKMSHRFGHEVLAPVRPGEVYDVPVHVWPTHYRLAAGHRLRVVVSSDDYPEIDSDAPGGTVTVHTGAGASSVHLTTR